MINGEPALVGPAFPTGKRNPQPDGTFTITADGGTGEVFTVHPVSGKLCGPDGELVKAPAGSCGPNEKFKDNGDGTASVYASNGLEYVFKYDGVEQ